MFFEVGFRRLAGMVFGLHMVAMGEMGVMPGHFMVALFVVGRRFVVMFRRLFMMLGGMLVMLVGIILWHGFHLSLTGAFRRRQTASFG